jgi:hypothetical protein
VVCVIFVGEVGAAQGEFIRRGENAFGVGVSLGVSRPLNTLSGLAALSALGTFDIGVAYSILAGDKQGQTEPPSRAFSPFASLHLIKQGDLLPLAFSLRTLLNVYSYSSDGSGTLSTWTFSGSIRSTLDLRDSLAIQPMLGVTSTKRAFASDLQENTTIVGYECGASVIWSKTKSIKYFVQVALALSKVEPVLSFGIGLVGILPKR